MLLRLLLVAAALPMAPSAVGSSSSSSSGGGGSRVASLEEEARRDFAALPAQLAAPPAHGRSGSGSAVGRHRSALRKRRCRRGRRPACLLSLARAHAASGALDAAAEAAAEAVTEAEGLRSYAPDGLFELAFASFWFAQQRAHHAGSAAAGTSSPQDTGAARGPGLQASTGGESVELGRAGGAMHRVMTSMARSREQVSAWRRLLDCVGLLEPLPRAAQVSCHVTPRPAPLRSTLGACRVREAARASSAPALESGPCPLPPSLPHSLWRRGGLLAQVAACDGARAHRAWAPDHEESTGFAHSIAEHWRGLLSLDPVVGGLLLPEPEAAAAGRGGGGQPSESWRWPTTAAHRAVSAGCRHLTTAAAASAEVSAQRTSLITSLRSRHTRPETPRNSVGHLQVLQVLQRFWAFQGTCSTCNTRNAQKQRWAPATPAGAGHN
jgi:hypothetical protein